MLALSIVLTLGLTATPVADTVSFRFAWPAPLTGEVSYARTRKRSDRPPSELKMQGRLVAETRGEELTVAFREWKVSGTGPAPAGADPLVEAAGRVSTVVTRAGAFVRVDGTERALEIFRDMSRAAPPEARPSIERLEKMAPALLAKDASETWSALVQFWIGNALEVGEDYESDTRVPIAALPGETVRLVSRIRVERRLPCPGVGAGCVEARLRTVPDAADVERVMKRFVAELALPAAQIGAALGEISATTEVVLVTEPSRLLPYRLEKIRTTKVAPAPGAPQEARPLEGRDVSVWTFTYPAAPAAKPAAR